RSDIAGLGSRGGLRWRRSAPVDPGRRGTSTSDGSRWLVRARQRLLDAYAGFATVFALRVRPVSVSETTAMRVAQQELEGLVSFPSHGHFWSPWRRGSASSYSRDLSAHDGHAVTGLVAVPQPGCEKAKSAI